MVPHLFMRKKTTPLTKATTPKRKVKISATIICKNEAPHIAECLESIADVDEVILCDTGSTDDTVEIAKKTRPKGLKVTHFPWEDHFAKARNAALDEATGSWCLVIDADETLPHGTIARLRRAIEAQPKAKTFHFACHSKTHPDQKHYMVRAHRRTPDIRWVGRVHEALTVDSGHVAKGCRLDYGYSEAHTADPDRVLRLLQIDYDQATARGVTPEPRNLYYLAREHIYRKNFLKAIPLLEERVKVIANRPECADANLYLAQCYWLTGQGDKARAACCQSLIMAPDCRETLEFMATLSFPEQAKTWAKFAKTATNEGVLFIRRP